MAIIDSNYRLHLDITYSNTANATTAASSIDSSLANMGRIETVTRNNAQVTLLITDLDEPTAVSIRDGIKSAWSATARTGGKVSVVRNNA